jgi:uncharacterized protein YaaQ
LTAAFSAGVHTVALRVTDPCGESAFDTVVVTAGDTTSPTVSGPGSLTTTNNIVPNLLPLIVVSDNCTLANALVISQSPTAGSTAGGSQYSITVTVTDAAGNSATSTTAVTVTSNNGDTKPPVIIHSPKYLVLPAGSDGKAKVPDFTCLVVARDNVTPVRALRITQTPTAGTRLEKGKHTITFTVTDAAGNSTSAKATLVVVDCTPPKIQSLTATPKVLAPANGQMINVTVTVNATDNCDSAPTSKIVEVRCDEYTGRNDIKITGPLTVQLAATRNKHGNGRVYTIVISSKDDSGNKTVKTVTVSVPK